MTDPILFIYSACLTAVAAPLYLLAEKRQSRRAAVILKPLASLGFIGAALGAGAARSTFGLLILTGLLLSLAGDAFLLSRHRLLFMGGLASFLLAQLLYSAAFILRGISWLPAAVGGCILIVAAIFVYRWLKPHLPERMSAPVGSYIVAISGMVALALGAVWSGAPVLLLPGAAAFYLSDLAVARDRFIARELINRLWGLPLYYMGQIMIASCAGGGGLSS